MKKLFRKFTAVISVFLSVPLAFGSVSALTIDTADTDALPESYSSVDQGYITSVKNQGDTGTCWAHAAMAACEASLIKNNGFTTDLDLSELNIAYSSYHTKSDKLGLFDGEAVSLRNYIQNGGDYNLVMNTLADWNGVVSEDANHSQYTSDKLHLYMPEEFDVYNKESQYCYDTAHLTDCYNVSGYDVDCIKKYVMDYASGATHINTDFYNEDTFTYYSPYYMVMSSSAHGVAIVGWDDNHPKESSSIDGYMPENDGAWLIKNSWGTDCGIDGYMWVSYEDACILDRGVTFFAFESADNYTYNYGYDDLTGMYSLNTEIVKKGVEIGNDVKMANVFTAQGDNEELEAVSFYTSNENLNYEAYIYTNLTQSSSPQEGTPVVSVSGNIPLKGYHTVKLDKPVSLEKGEKFSVVIRLFSDASDTEVKVNIDMQDDNQELKRNEDKKVSEYGESFYCTDNTNWVDLKSILKGNMRIKAFTNADSEPEPEKDEYSEYGGYTRQQLINMLNDDCEKSTEFISTNYKYTHESIYKLMKMVSYANEAIHNSDLFLAVELWGLHNKINNQMNNMDPFTMAEDLETFYSQIISVPYYDNMNCWNDFISIYNKAVELSEQGLVDDSNYGYYYDETRSAFINYMNEAIAKGYNFSYLQNYGDINNDSKINIADVTYLQKILAGLEPEDFYSHYNSDVDGNQKININDATAIQHYLCDIDDHFAVYDNNFNGIDGYDESISKEESESYLRQALQTTEEWDDFLYMDISHNTDDIRMNLIYQDGKQALENADSFKSYELLFKARNLLRCLGSGGKG